MRDPQYPSWSPKYAHVGPPYWDGEAAIVVGAGSSLKGFDWERLRGRGRVLAVKSAWRDLPFADCCFGLDLPWMQRDRVELTELAARMPLYLAVEDRTYLSDLTPQIPGAIYLKQIRKQDGRLSDDPGVIEAGGNSGYGALNLAYLKRPKCIVLLGYDYKGDHYAPDRYTHNPPGHNNRYLPGWARIFNDTRVQLQAAGIDVINASPDSELATFTRTTIDAALHHLDRLRSART